MGGGKSGITCSIVATMAWLGLCGVGFSTEVTWADAFHDLKIPPHASMSEGVWAGLPKLFSFGLYL